MFGLVAGAAACAAGASDPQRPIALWCWAAIPAAAIAFSFCNHVLLPLAAHASLGKAICGLRVASVVDSRRPRLLQFAGRWLFGFYWTLVWVPIHVVSDSDVEQQDAVGLRVVRRAD